MKCLILAAGQGKRIKQITKKFPKCLIKINKESLLKRQIRLLNSLNIKNITIVKGFKAKKINFKSVNYIIINKFIKLFILLTIQSLLHQSQGSMLNQLAYLDQLLLT